MSELSPTTRRLRVLLVPDYLQWVTGTIAKQLTRHNPWIEQTICTGKTLARLSKKYGQVSWNVDLVHFLTEYEPERCRGVFPNDLPRIHAIYHVEDWQLTRELMTTCDAIHVISPTWRDELLAAGAAPDKTILVETGVDTKLFRPPSIEERRAVRNRLGLSPATFAVGMFARMSKDNWNRKGVDIFTTALTRLRRLVPDLAAILVGPGWGDVCKQLRAEGIRCCWNRYLDGPSKVAEVYRALDLYWVTSRIEGGPVPLLEAMATGVCCVSTPVGIAPRFIRSGENGFLVPIGESDSFVERSAALAADMEGRTEIGKKAQRTIAERADWKHTTGAVHELYKSAFRSWSERTGKSVPVDIDAVRQQFTTADVSNSELTAIPPSFREIVWAEEQLNWIRELIYCREYSRAVRTAAEALAARPTNRQLAAGLGKMLIGPKSLHRLNRFAGVLMPSVREPSTSR